jgi:hypothetical protein
MGDRESQRSGEPMSNESVTVNVNPMKNLQFGTFQEARKLNLFFHPLDSYFLRQLLIYVQ